MRDANEKACPRAYKKLDERGLRFGQAAAQKLFAAGSTADAGFRIRGNQMVPDQAAICAAMESFDEAP